MQKLFNKILVPVNFNRNTGLVMDKAIQIANFFSCDIHLLHVQTPNSVVPFLYDGRFTGSFVQTSNANLVNQLQELEAQCRVKLKDGLLIRSTVVSGHWFAAMKETIISSHIDLVIIPKARRKFASSLIQRIDLDKLSLQTKCPILTVTRSFNAGHLQNIVVPVHDFLPVKKLSIATYLSSRNDSRIHLMGSGHDSNGKSAESSCLHKAYHLLSDYSNVRIHCALPANTDSPANTLSYAKTINADLIVVNTGKESLFRGWWNKLVKKYLYKESDIPVLTIAPQP
ncbi:MAG: universal stress protein [Bacteroidota bacterium]|nr:universal stress protein [Bacteroidota bacterium]